MNNPLQEELLGYVLGALDATEERNIQQKIEQDPSLQDQVERIREGLLPLEALEAPTGMRPGMARRTCEWVSGVDKDPGLAPVYRIETTDHIESFQTETFHSESFLTESFADCPIEPEAAPAAVSTAGDARIKNDRASQSFQLMHPGTWSMTDALAGVAIIAVMGSLLLPALSYQRYNSRLLSCQDNMNQIGRALLQYSDIHNGQFVEIPSQGRLSASGYFAPALKEAGLIEDDNVFACAGLGQSKPVHIPSITQIKSATGGQLDHLRRTMSGNYGYSMGYQSDDRYRPLTNRGLTNTVLVADMPSLNRPGRHSLNHGRWGQNCLFGDGRVEFIRGDSVGEDAIFENDYGVVAPGTSEHDSVIAPSHLSPVKW